MARSVAIRFVEVLDGVLDRRRDLEADVRPQRIVGRNEDGSARLVRLDGECVTRGGQGGYNGEVVTSLPSLVGRRGTSGVALVAQRSAAATLWFERMDPPELLRGLTMLVSMLGRGFTASTRFEFLLAGVDGAIPSVINPGITILDTTFVSSTEVQLELQIAVDAELLANASPVAYG